MEELKRLREDRETTLDCLLSREHECTKQLLSAEQILHRVIEEDQRIATAWSMWSEALLTGLEWSEANSFDSVSRYPVVIWGVCCSD